MVLATTLIGTPDMVRARLRTWRGAGVDTVRLYPAGTPWPPGWTTSAGASTWSGRQAVNYPERVRILPRCEPGCARR